MLYDDKKITEEELLSLGWMDTGKMLALLKIFKNRETKQLLLYDAEEGKIHLMC